MKSINKHLLTFSAVLVGGVSSALADPFVFANGDLILGVQASSGTGANKNVFFNLGAGTALRDNANQGFKGNINATLVSVFGANWYLRSDVYFGVVANLNQNPNSGIGNKPAVNGDPSRTFYVSAAADAPGEGALYTAASYPGSALGTAGNNLSGLETALVGLTTVDPETMVETVVFPPLTAEADGSAILTQSTQPTQWANGWTTWNPIPGASFGPFTGSGSNTAGIQNKFGKGTPSTYVDIQRVLSTNTGAIPTGVIGGGTYEATIAISNTGAITMQSSTPASTYTAWIGTFPAITLPSDKLETADFDNDGFSNLEEFVLNGDPSVSGQAISPTLNTSGANFVFAFTRRDDSKTEAPATFQYGSNLVGWTDVAIPETTGPSGAATVTVTPGDAVTDGISISLPKTEAVGNKLFGRIKIVK